MEHKNKGKKQRGLIYLGFLLLFLIGLTVTIGMCLWEMQKDNRAQQDLEQLRDKYVVEEDDTQGVLPANTDETVDELMKEWKIKIPKRKIDWKALQKENPDIYAWLYVPGTNIDYPILQHPKEDNYYVDHNLDGSTGYPGCLTTQKSYNSKDFLDANTCIYGHNMKNGSMFHDLHGFADEAFFQKTRYAYVYLPDATYAYEIFAAYTFSDVLIPAAYDFSSYRGFKAYLEEIFAIRGMDSHFRKEISVTAKNHIITFSTCLKNSDHNYRWLVQAVMLNDPTLSAEELRKTLQRKTE